MGYVLSIYYCVAVMFLRVHRTGQPVTAVFKFVYRTAEFAVFNYAVQPLPSLLRMELNPIT